MSADSGMTSGDSGSSPGDPFGSSGSGDSGMMSGDSGMTSGDTGMMSGDSGMMSGDSGMTSGDTGMTSGDSGMTGSPFTDTCFLDCTSQPTSCTEASDVAANGGCASDCPQTALDAVWSYLGCNNAGSGSSMTSGDSGMTSGDFHGCAVCGGTCVPSVYENGNTVAIGGYVLNDGTGDYYTQGTCQTLA